MRQRSPHHQRLTRGQRRVVTLMLWVQGLLTLLMAIPMPAAAVAAGPASAPGGVMWVMVCTPQGMQQVPLQGLQPVEAQQTPPDSHQDGVLRVGHCLLCHQASAYAPPLILIAFVLLPAAPEPTPDSARPAPPAQAATWRPLLARPPPLLA